MIFNHKSDTFIEVDSAKIYYEENGNNQKQCIIFLHGGFGNIEDFNQIIPLLDNEYYIIGIDSRGQGKSTLGNIELTYEQIEKDVACIINKLSLKNPIILGFSDGGIVALRLACSQKFKINKLILIGTSWHSKSLENSRKFLEAITAEKWKEKFPETFKKYQKINPNPDFENLTKSMVKMWIDEKTTGHPNENVKNISIPTLIIRGDKDHLISKESSFELSENIPDSDLANIPFSGHEVYAERPQMIMIIINEFLEK